MNENLSSALKGLSKEQIDQIMKATKRRTTIAIRSGGIVDRVYIERTIIEYAEELSEGRMLEDSGTVRVALECRNYGEQYLARSQYN